LEELTTASTAYYESRFRLRYVESKGDVFQDFFSTIMEMRYPGDFVRVRGENSETIRTTAISLPNDNCFSVTRRAKWIAVATAMLRKAAASQLIEDTFILSHGRRLVAVFL
jgi:sirohydrochlorin ferrochelatase